MTRKKANPLSRKECGRLGGLASAASPNRSTPFADIDEHCEISSKGGKANTLEHMRAIASSGGKIKAPKSHYKYRRIRRD